MTRARSWCVSSVDSHSKREDVRHGGGRPMGGKRWKWTAPMSVARSVEAGFFPLDQELQVPDGHLLPHAQDTMVGLSSELPFRRAASHLEQTLAVVVHAS